MGNDSSSSISEGSGFIGKLNKSYDFMTEVSDPRFGDIYVYKHRTEKKYIAKRGKLSINEQNSFSIDKKQKKPFLFYSPSFLMSFCRLDVQF